MKNNVLIAGDPGDVRRKLTSLLAHDEANSVYCVELLTRPRHHVVTPRCRDAANSRVFQLACDDTAGIAGLVAELNPRTIINLSNSPVCIDPNAASRGQGPSVTATSNLLEAARHAWSSGSTQRPSTRQRCYLQVSTMLPVDPEIAIACRNSNTREGLREIAPQPSDAVAGQRLARQWFQYYGLPTINVSVPNIFGPEQNRDQFFPAIIETLLEKKPLRLSQGRRRWAFVEDIVDAIVHVARHGQAGEHYRVECDKGEQSDIEMAQLICDQLDQLTPCASGSYRDYVQATLSNSMAQYVEPPMHELGTSLGWQPLNDFHCSLAATVRQYIT